MINGITSIVRSNPITGDLTVRADNGAAITFTSAAYDVAAWSGVDISADLDAIIAKLVALPIRDEESIASVRADFAAECLQCAEDRDVQDAWREYAHVLVHAAIEQAPDPHPSGPRDIAPAGES